MSLFKEKPRFFRYVIISIISGLLIGACSESSQEVPIEQNPKIESTRVDPNWNLAQLDSNVVEAKVSDPQGLENIDMVTVTIRNSAGTVLLEDFLYDDGSYFYPRSGDVIAGDGVYRNRFVASTEVDTLPGSYQVEINVWDRDGNKSDPAFTDILFGYSYPTEFLSISVPDTLKNGFVENFFYVTIAHEKGITAIEQIVYKLFRRGQSALLASHPLYNDGDFNNSGDWMAGDSIFSYRLNSAFAAGRLGWYDLQFESLDQFGRFDQTSRFPIYIENGVGEIVETTVPERMQRPAGAGVYNRELLTARVTDPQGLADVDSVYFFSRKPDGTFANNGLPILLRDNGKPFNINNPSEEVGDVLAGDGIFSFSLILFNDAQTGVYEFSFYMRDRVGNLTPVKLDSLEVF